ncbi:heavy metal translocating P-type ATPase [Rubrobacter taiwanensis]|uniref:heavy metal translocating P-type ATPase n=1 Tax=Rubrobacter taiwanensis TaxID=185139 RepID=UPI0014048265|nr:cation-translocating P-type ATPase [Rubrobacter taiwanensis]
MRRTRLRVEGMDCPSCAAKIESRVGRIPGVSEVRVSVAGGTLAVWHDPELAPGGEIARAVGALGYRAEESLEERPRRAGVASLRLAGVLLALGFGFGFAGAPGWVGDGAFAAALVLAGLPIFRRAWLAVRNRFALDMNVLMSLAAVGAAGLGEWAEGALVVFLFAVGNALEERAAGRARRSIRELMRLSPERACVLRGGGEEEVPAGELRLGDVIVVRPGERIAADGVVVGGVSAVDQSPITGESAPVIRREGDEVFAGTINAEGALEVRVTRRAGETTISRIVRMVEEAQERRAPAQRFVDRFARYYTPLVAAGAALVFLVPSFFFGGAWDEWFYRALVLLVIACPCALVISTPVSIISSLTAATREGALIKGGAFLEAFSGLRAVALDKTGTLTAGRPAVTEVVPLNGASEEQALELAAALEDRSQHPVGRAIAEHARRQGIVPEPAASFTSLTGLGVKGVVGGRELLAGSPELFAIPLPPEVERLRERGDTVVLLGDGRELIAAFGVADAGREGAAESVAALRRSGVEEIVMLTGDGERVARRVAEGLGIGYRAGLLPEEKLAELRRLRERHGPVAMVGDGINDAPALAEADIGVAMGAAGTDVALESADVALMRDDLSQLARLVERSRRTMRVIWQNVVFSIGVKAVFLVLGAMGMADLWMAIFADTGAMLLVIANGLRLLRRS